MKVSLLASSSSFVFLLTFLCGTCAFTEIAFSATSDWDQRPSWANGSANNEMAQETPARTSRYTRHQKENDISPFSPGSNNIAIDVGQVFLMGDLSSKYADAIGTQLHYTYGVSDIFDFDSSLGYSSHSNGQYSMATLLTGLRTNFSWYDKIVPYGVFGVGFYRPAYDQTIGSGPSATTVGISPILFGVHLGPGVDLQLTKQLFFGTSLVFHDIFGTTTDTAAGPVGVGGTFISFFVQAGYTF